MDSYRNRLPSPTPLDRLPPARVGAALNQLRTLRAFWRRRSIHAAHVIGDFSEQVPDLQPFHDLQAAGLIEVVQDPFKNLWAVHPAAGVTR